MTSDARTLCGLLVTFLNVNKELRSDVSNSFSGSELASASGDPGTGTPRLLYGDQSRPRGPDQPRGWGKKRGQFWMYRRLRDPFLEL